MLRKVLRITGVVLAFAALAVVVLALRAKWLIERSYAHVPEPPIVADTSPEGVARGEVLFGSLCVECHGGPDGRATGKQLEEVPAFLGKFYSSNLAHPEHGVHARTDGELARVLRHGVLPDGRLSVVMNGFGKIGDADVAALLGYMRSRPKVLEPGGVDQPKTEISVAGAMILTYVAGLKVQEQFQSVPVPPKGPTVEYGRYMAEALDCVGCHTDGFAANKMQEPGAFAGGFEMVDPTGATIYSKNLTFDETGIGSWSLDDFERAVTRGVTKDGFLVRKPMPLFSRLDRTDVEAIYEFLQSAPKVHRPNTPGGHPLKKATAADPPDVLFVNLGCASCHGDKGPYRDKLASAVAKTDADVASWILDPRATKPDTMMPSFQHVIDRAQAEKLAKYVKEIAKKHGG